MKSKRFAHWIWLAAVGVLLQGAWALTIPFQLQRIDHIVIRCHNFQTMLDFYINILGCTIDHPEDVRRFGGALTHLRAGDAYIDLLSCDESDLSSDGAKTVLKMHNGGEGVPDMNSVSQIQFGSDRSTLDHLCLRVEPFDEKAVLYYLASNGVRIMGHGQRKGAEGTGPSIYIKDPEGNAVELKGPEGQPSIAEESFQEVIKQAQIKVLHDGSSHEANAVNNESCLSDKNKDTEREQANTEESAFDVAVTPCIRICRYNADFYDGQVCIGCFREAFEISSWSSMSASEKRFTILDAIDRLDTDSSSGDSPTFEGSITRNELVRQAEFWQQEAAKEDL